MEAPRVYAVIFTSQRTPGDDGYAAMAERMMALAARQDGFLGAESARGKEGAGVTVSYWRSLEDIARWRDHPEHREAQRLGRERWYDGFHLRIAEVVDDRPWTRLRPSKG